MCICVLRRGGRPPLLSTQIHMEDPYYGVKREICSSIESCRDMFRRWKELNQAGHLQQEELEEMQWLNSEIRKLVSTIRSDLEDVEETITIAARSPERFGLCVKDISERREFVAGSRSQCNSILQDMEGAKGKTARMKGGASEPRVKDDGVRDNDELISEQLLVQRSLEREQDKHLDELHSAVGRTKEMAKTINVEVTEQVGMLQHMEQSVDSLRSKLQRTTAKVNNFIDQ
eukprot:Sspe_Gene.97442::Locus_71024_Transcript_1_1_Confidence_1.000_Length_693::g.97442::m.97442/K08498/STX6; syntaxin 6